MPRPRDKTRYTVPALEKGLDILELLARHGQVLSQAQVADRLGRSVSELFRMLTCLEARGYIHRGDDGFYRLTAKLFELSHQYPPTARLLDAALAHMRQLSETLRQSCHLAVPSDSDILVIAEVDSPLAMGFTVRVGSRFPMTETTSGLVLLAFQPDDVQQRWVSRRSLKQLGAVLRQVRKTAAIRRPSLQIAAVSDLSCPVLDHTGAAVAALTIPFLASRDDVESDPAAALDQLRETARSIAMTIGGQNLSAGARP